MVAVTNIRTKGCGEKVRTYAHEWTKENNYKNVSLSSGLQHTDAHHFYEDKLEYAEARYVFKTTIK